MNKYKQYYLTLTLFFALLVFWHVTPLLIIDPLNILKRDITKNEFFIKEMRFQSAPIINKYEFNSAIVGTSMAENFNAYNSEKELGGAFQNLSMSGSLLSERRILLEYLLSKKKIKTLIISIDNSTQLQRNRGIPISSWSFLYNENKFDDLLLYTNRKYSAYINCHSLFNHSFFEIAYGKCPKSKTRKTIESLTEWQSNPKHNKRFGGVHKWIEHRNSSQVKQSINDIVAASKLIKNNKISSPETNIEIYDPIEFSKHIVPLIEEHPETRFILYFPPYSIIKFAIDIQTKPHLFHQYENMVSQIVLETQQFNNAETHWFGDRDFMREIANYKDLTHINGHFNNVFLRDFRSGKSIINSNNYKEHLAELKSDAKYFDLIQLADRFQP